LKQSTVIFGVLLFAFIMYVTLRGQLPGYLALFKPKVAANKKATSAAFSTQGGASFMNGLNLGNGTSLDLGTLSTIAEISIA
jgi:hypothetical protein